MIFENWFASEYPAELYSEIERDAFYQAWKAGVDEGLKRCALRTEFISEVYRLQGEAKANALVGFDLANLIARFNLRGMNG